jgi:hypothetical protein
VRNRLGLHSGVHRHPLEVLGRDRPGLVRHRQALLDQGDELILAQPLAPARQRGAVERQLVAEYRFAAEVLVIGVLDPTRAQHLVRQRMQVLEDQQPGDQARGQRRLARSSRAHRTEAPQQKLPIDLPRQPHQRVAHVDDLVQRRSEKVVLTFVAWLAHHVPPRHRSRCRENHEPRKSGIWRLL